jgi:hypothetical protein
MKGGCFHLPSGSADRAQRRVRIEYDDEPAGWLGRSGCTAESRLGCVVQPGAGERPPAPELRQRRAQIQTDVGVAQRYLGQGKVGVLPRLPTSQAKPAACRLLPDPLPQGNAGQSIVPRNGTITSRSSIPWSAVA